MSLQIRLWLNPQSVTNNSDIVKYKVCYLLGYSIHTLVLLDPLSWFSFILCKFFCNVWADVAPAFLEYEKEKKNRSKSCVKWWFKKIWISFSLARNKKLFLITQYHSLCPLLFFNPLTLKSDQHLISPHNITPNHMLRSQE